jgi:RNA polymerase sigma-70 factor (ECF subfamily)
MLYNKEKELITLIEEFIDGNEPAFEEIARLVTSDLVNIAYRYLGNVEDAKDIAQEVLLKLYRKLRGFRHASKASTWIYRITLNTCIDSLRRKSRLTPLEEAITRDQEAEGRVSQELERQDIRQRVQCALAKLPLRQKNVLILKHFQGLKINQISQILGCSPSSVKTHLARAVERLRKEVQNEMS